MFFRDFQSNLRRIDAIQKVSWLREVERHHPKATYRVIFNDDAECDVDQIGYEQILRASWKATPAASGTVILQLKEEMIGNDPFHRTPVFAWALDFEGGLHPIVAQGEWDEGSWVALNPDGSVCDSFGSVFPSEEAYLKTLDDDKQGVVQSVSS